MTGETQMASDLVIVGPIRVPFQKQQSGSAKQISRDDAKAFWDDKDAASVGDKQGCYVFALQAAKGFKAWYVGKATKSMAQECFEFHKLQHYNEVLFKGHKGTPVMFFVVLDGAKKKVSKNTIDEMETFFIQTAVTKNPDLKNIQKANLPNWTVKGVIRGSKGKRPTNATQFRKMIGLGG